MLVIIILFVCRHCDTVICSLMLCEWLLYCSFFATVLVMCNQMLCEWLLCGLYFLTSLQLSAGNQNFSLLPCGNCGLFCTDDVSYSDTSVINYQTTKCHNAETKNMNIHYNQKPSSQCDIKKVPSAMLTVHCFVLLESNYCWNVFMLLYTMPINSIQPALTTPFHRASWIHNLSSLSLSSELTLTITFTVITVTAV
jgi:hypothetical protein